MPAVLSHTLAPLNQPAPWWLGSGAWAGHTQTIWAAKMARVAAAANQPTQPTPYQRERWTAPDDDFIDVDFSPELDAAITPLLVLFHGLEGSSQSHYARAFAHWAGANQLGFCVPHFRGCSGEYNLSPRAYHSGDHAEIDWILRRLRTRWPARPIVVVGISLGGNALLRWAQEMGSTAAQVVSAVAAVCSPIDMPVCGKALGEGLNAWVYTPMFLRSMKPRALHKLAQHPGLFNRTRLLAARNLYEFDAVFTAPLHGFASTDDYWTRASARPRLKEIALPALVLHPQNDPFVPAAARPQANEVNGWVTLWQPPHGGHVGFVQGGFPGHVAALPQAVGAWLQAHLTSTSKHHG